MPVAFNHLAGRSTERLAALSDGIFAVAMTLLVLDLRVPTLDAMHSSPELAHALFKLAPQVVAYLMSFLTLGIFWTGQQVQLSHYHRSDRHLTWIYIAFLFAVSLMPFSTKLLADFIHFRLALLCYWANMLLLSVILFAAWTYAEKAALVHEETPPEIGKTIKRRILVAQALYAFGAALCVINTTASILFIALVEINFVIAPKARWLSEI